jgi:nitrite reductase (cytochrome c-552)
MRTITYIIVGLIAAAATAGAMWLWQNILTRKEEARLVAFPITHLTEDTVDPAEWGKNFPRQYDSYRRPVDVQRTKYGGNETVQKLDEYPNLRTIFAGYAFSIDYREERGHAFMLSDQDETERVHQVQQPGACLHCHASVLPAYRELGRAAGAPDQPGFNLPQVMKGFEVACAMPLAELRSKVEHPVTCLDCHDPETMQLRITRPGFLNGIVALAESSTKLPHLQSIEAWRTGDRKTPYDPNALASRQEMRSFVCGQCHVEYYFRGPEKLVTYPWASGLGGDQILDYYDAAGFRDWVHKESGAEVLKAQHPEFELWSQGTHARNGVACADCHMPYVREGAIKVTDHQPHSPLLNAARACQTCHRQSESELQARVEAIQDRTRELLDASETALVELIHDLGASAKTPALADKVDNARNLQRRAQFLWDFVAADNSMGFHAPQESARLLGLSIDAARRGQLELRSLPDDAIPATSEREN